MSLYLLYNVFADMSLVGILTIKVSLVIEIF